MMNSILEKYCHIVHQLSDSFEGGFARVHPEYDIQKLESIFFKKNAKDVVEEKSTFHKPRPRQQFASLQDIAACVRSCQQCPLGQTRTHAVPGEGVEQPLVLVIGEGPGFDEDQMGRPFVGKSGQYLDKWLNSIGLDRTTNTYIANIVKCRPPQNRDPSSEEMHACAGYLEEQIRLLKPRFILACGRISGQFLSQKASALAALRGKIHDYTGIPMVITYHPAAVLRNQDLRRPVWDDLKTLKQLIDQEGGS